jgi:hypothetical protein
MHNKTHVSLRYGVLRLCEVFRCLRRFPVFGLLLSSVRPMEPSSGVVGPSVAGPLVPVAIGDSSSAPEQVQEKKPNLVASLLSRTPLIGGNRAETVCQRQLRRLGVQLARQRQLSDLGHVGSHRQLK